MSDDHPNGDEPEPNGDPGVDGTAWREFCRTLEAAGQLVLDHSTDPLDRVEGFRYLSRLTRGGLQAFVENGDRAWAQILPIPHNLKIGCDNPDALYQSVAVDPAHRYRLRGPRGTVNYLSIGAYSGGYAAGAATPGRQGVIEDNDPDPEAVVDIIASVEEPELAPGQRWLRMEPITTTVIVRNFYLDRTTERPSELTLTCLDPSRPDPGPFTSAQLQHGLAMTGLYVHGVTQRFLGWVEDIFADRPNTLEFLPDDDGPGGWGDPNQLFRHGSWMLEPGEALVVTVPAIDAHYWNFQLNNMWEESLDYVHHQVTVNMHTAVYEPDGTARLIVTDHDPGVGNWIDTAYHHHGTWGLRYNQVMADLAPSIELVPVSELGG